MWNPHQKYFFENATKRYNFAIGARRSGKTFPSYYYIPKIFRAVKDESGLKVILGTTKGTLTRNLIEPLQNIWGTGLVGNINSENICTMFGMKVHCLGTDNVKRVDQIRGSSIARVAWDEIVTGHKDVWEMVKTSLDQPYSRLYGTGNPDSPIHHIYEFINDPNNANDVFYQQYSLYDNPKLDPSVIIAFENAYPIGSVWHSRLVLGEWVRAQGVIYSCFIASNINNGGHLINDKQIPEGREYVCSIDYGISNNTVALLWRVVKGKAYLIKWYIHSGRNLAIQEFGDNTEGGQLDESIHAENIVKMIKSVDGAFPNLTIIVDPAAPGMISHLKRNYGLNANGAENTLVGRPGKPGGIENTFSDFHHKRIFIHEECKPLIKGLQTYSWDDKLDENGREKPIKEKDDEVDALRYFCQSYLYRYYPVRIPHLTQS